MKRHFGLVLIMTMLFTVSACRVEPSKGVEEKENGVAEVGEHSHMGQDGFPVEENDNKNGSGILPPRINTSDKASGSPQMPDVAGKEVEGRNPYYIDVKLRPEDAYDIFKGEYFRAKVKEIELDKEKDSYVYKVEGFMGNSEYEVKINPFDGTIIKIVEDDDNKTVGEINREDLANIPVLLQEAVENAAEGYSLRDWSVEVEDGIIEFNIEFSSAGGKMEYKYDLRSGKLLKSKQK